MTVFSSMEYPHWLMIAGTILLTLGLVTLALQQRSVAAEPSPITSDDDPFQTDLTPEDAYHRTAKEKRRARWAESSGEGPLDAESKV